MKLGITGYRNYTDYDQFCDYVDKIPGITKIISGGCQGTDKLAERYAADHGIPVEIYEPNWDLYGRRAGPIRNSLIVSNSDQIIAFIHPDGKGTLDTIKKAKKARKVVIEVRIN